MSQPFSLGKVHTGFVLGRLSHSLLSAIRNITFSKVNMERIELEEIYVAPKITLLAPTSDKTTYKGQAGKIGVFGGSLDYTGAPFFSAISSLKVGADLAYVFTTQSAAPVIKSYSPELIVHPYLDDKDVEGKIKPWIKKLNVAVIGPGLGRLDSTLEVMKIIIKLCRETNGGIPLVIDADGLYFISEELKNENFMLKDYPNQVVLTPNYIEFERLVGKVSGENKSKPQRAESLLEQCKHLTIVCKGEQDEIFNSKKKTKVSGIGSSRRCGGQGDLLSGSLGTFLHWALRSDHILEEERVLLAAYAACRLTRECNYESYVVKGRSMLCTDMIDQIHSVFVKCFENSKN